jgi:hypothetical protein
MAFPKCGSDLMRTVLNLKYDKDWNNGFYADNWAKASPKYCHTKPDLFMSRLRRTMPPRDYNNLVPFTVVRNTYQRLVSSWAYLQGFHIRNSIVFPEMTFGEFIELIFANRSNLSKLKMSWMFLPFELYFGELTERIAVLQLLDTSSIQKFLETNNINLGEHDLSIATNKSDHRSYETYYTDPDILKKVNEIYKYEIERFGFTL